MALRKLRRPILPALLTTALLAAWPPLARASNELALELAREHYHHTRYKEALQIAEPSAPKIPGQWALIGQCYFMLGDYKKAIDALEQATAAEPRNAVYWNWLGKAYGRRAETGFKLTAPSNAGKARQHFEKAVALDPANLEAVDDLFEYYLEAPGFLGGGEDKAAKLAETVRARAVAKYEALQARLAGKRKDAAAAERHWRKAAELAPDDPGALVNLAKFLARNGKSAEADPLFDQAMTMAPAKHAFKFERAKIYSETKRNTAQARQLLNEYLKAPLTAADPPRADAQKLLASLAR